MTARRYPFLSDDRLAAGSTKCRQAVAFSCKGGPEFAIDAQEADGYLNNWFGDKLNGSVIFAFAPSVMDAESAVQHVASYRRQGYFSDKDVDGCSTRRSDRQTPPIAARRCRPSARSSTTRPITRPLFIDVYIYGVTKGLKWTPGPTA